MPRTKISEFSATPASNTDIDSINISEGCAPSGINDAIRELMAQLKDFQTGAVGDSFNGPVGTTTAAAGAFTTLSSTGNTTLGDASGDSVTINGTATFANANPTLSAGTANGVTYLNGSKVVTSGSALTFDGTTLNNSGAFGTSTAALTLKNSTAASSSNIVEQQFFAANSFSGLDTIAKFGALNPSAGANNYGSFYWSLANAGSPTEQMRLTSTGLGIGTSSPAYKLQVAGTVGVSGILTSTVTNGQVVAASSGNTSGIYSNFSNTGGTLQYGIDNSTGSYIYSGSSNYAGFIGTTGATSLVLATNSVVRATLDSSGNLGLGVTPSAWFSSSKVLQIGATASLSDLSGAYTLLGQNYKTGTAGQDVYLTTGAASLYSQNAGGHRWYSAPSGTAGANITLTQAMTLDASGNLIVGGTSALGNTTNRGNITLNGTSSALYSLGVGGSLKGYLFHGGTDMELQNSANGYLSFATNGSERARIDSSGNLLVGTTSQLSGGSYGNHQIQASVGDGGRAALVVYNNSGVDNSDSIVAIKSSATTTSSQRFIQFYADAGATAMGGIVGNGASNVQFAAISDAREKTNVQPISGSLEKISALNPVEFDWIKSGEHVNSGFIAQDVEQVFPEFVVENMSDDGQEARKGLTGGMTSGIIPHLVKAIQELKAEFDAYKASHP